MLFAMCGLQTSPCPLVSMLDRKACYQTKLVSLSDPPTHAHLCHISYKVGGAEDKHFCVNISMVTLKK